MLELTEIKNPSEKATLLRKAIEEKISHLLDKLTPWKIENMTGKDQVASLNLLIDKVRLLEGQSTENFYVITRGLNTDQSVRSSSESTEDHQRSSQVQDNSVREEVREDDIRGERTSVPRAQLSEPITLLRGTGLRSSQVSSLGNASEADRSSSTIISEESERIGAVCSDEQRIENRDQGSGQTGSVEGSKPRRGRPRRIRGYESGGLGQGGTPSTS